MGSRSPKRPKLSKRRASSQDIYDTIHVKTPDTPAPPLLPYPTSSFVKKEEEEEEEEEERKPVVKLEFTKSLPKEVWFMISHLLDASFGSTTRSEDIQTLKSLRLVNRELSSHATPQLFHDLTISQPVERSSVAMEGIAMSLHLAQHVRGVKLYSGAMLTGLIAPKFIASLRRKGETADDVDGRICGGIGVNVIQKLYDHHGAFDTALRNFLLACTGLAHLGVHFSDINFGTPKFTELCRVRFLQSVTVVLEEIDPVHQWIHDNSKQKQDGLSAGGVPNRPFSMVTRGGARRRLADVAEPARKKKVVKWEDEKEMSVDNPENVIRFRDSRWKAKAFECLTKLEMDVVLMPDMEAHWALLTLRCMFVQKLDTLSLTYHPTISTYAADPSHPIISRDQQTRQRELFRRFSSLLRPLSLRSFFFTTSLPPHTSLQHLWFFRFDFGDPEKQQPLAESLSKLQKLHLENIVLSDISPITTLINKNQKILTEIVLKNVKVELYGRGSNANMWRWKWVFGTISKCRKLGYLRVEDVGYVCSGEQKLPRMVSGEDSGVEEEDGEEDEAGYVVDGDAEGDVSAYKSMVETVVMKGVKGEFRAVVEGTPGFVDYLV